MPRNKPPKRIKRRDKRPRGAADWSGDAKKHGPFGIFSNVKLFYFLGAIIMVGSLAGGAIASRSGSTKTTATPVAAEDTTTPTPDPLLTPTPTVEQVKQWTAPPAMSIDTTKTYTAVIQTDKGEIDVQLFAADEPSTVNNFVFLAQQDFFNNLSFFYVDPDYYVATGDPGLDPSLNTKGGPGYDIPAELSTHPIVVGSLGMFLGTAPKTLAGSRFFIALSPSRLDASDFSSFGEVKSGLDVLQSLAAGDKIQSVTIRVQ